MRPKHRTLILWIRASPSADDANARPRHGLARETPHVNIQSPLLSYKWAGSWGSSEAGFGDTD